jgi:hypothetical protein
MEMTPWFLLTVLVLIALAAPRYGVDSRLTPPGEEPPPPRPVPTPWGDVRALAHAVARRVRRPATG